MGEEKDPVDGTTETPAQEVETKSTDDTSSDVAVDYKAELAKVEAEKAKISERLGKAEYKLTQKDKEERASRKVAEEDSSSDSEEEQSIDVEALVKKETEKRHLEFVADTIEEIINSESADTDERALIKHYYENKIVRSGLSRNSILNDIRDAKILANRPRLEKRLGEIKAGMRSGDTTSSGSTTGQPGTSEDVIELTPLEKRILSRAGLTAKDLPRP